jgi:translation initiation factor 2 alpha subunit (eIF-2alpha)
MSMKNVEFNVSIVAAPTTRLVVPDPQQMVDRFLAEAIRSACEKAIKQVTEGPIPAVQVRKVEIVRDAPQGGKGVIL